MTHWVLISQFTVRVKILMRKKWAYKTIDWDDPAERVGKFFQRNVYMLKYHNFPRSTKPEDAVGKSDLVIFSDGSKDAYDGVIYAR